MGLTMLMLSYQSVLAQGNLVVNGSFDTDTSDWILTNGASYNALFGNPAGSVALDNPDSKNAPTASQEINSLTPGTLYVVSGDYMRGAISGVTDSGFAVALDGVYLFETTASTSYIWYHFSFDYTATSTSALLSLSTPIGEKGNSYTFDNIAMYAVPEPGSLCLIGMGGIMGAMLFRNRRKC